MLFFKEKITEKDLANNFLLGIFEDIENIWPAVHKNLKDHFKEKFILKDEKKASFDLFLASVAQDLPAVKNLFPKDQAERIEEWIFKIISDNFNDYAVTEVKTYIKEFQDAIQNNSIDYDPLSIIPTRLLHNWLGENIQNFEIEMNGKKTRIINPVLLAMVSNILLQFIGTLKRLMDDFKIIEPDIHCKNSKNEPNNCLSTQDEKKRNFQNMKIIAQIIGCFLWIVAGILMFIFWLIVMYKWLGFFGIILAFILTPGFVIFPLIFWIVEGIFPVFYFILFAIAILGAIIFGISKGNR